MVATLGFTSGVAWELESPFLDVDYEDRSVLGAPTLKHLATKKILSDQRNLTQDHFSRIPWPIAEGLWQYLIRSGKRTFYMWKMLSTVYPFQFRRLSQHCEISVPDPQFPLSGYTELITSPACSWATQLSLWTEFARVPELVDLAKVTSLVSLEVNTSISNLDVLESQDQEAVTLNDRIMRTWNELAETSGAFQHLRVLKLYHQQDLTGQTFRYLSNLPALEYCVLIKCDQLIQKDAVKLAKSQGWFIEHSVADQKMCQFSPFVSPRTSNPRILWRPEHSDGPLSPSLPDGIPMLQFSVGQRCEKLRDYEVTIFCRKLDNHNAPARRNKRGLVDTASSGRDEGIEKKEAKKPAMKRRGKDLSDVLAEFR